MKEQAIMMNNGLTEAELTILGLVAEGIRDGYDLNRVIDERGLRDWLNVGTASLDYLLDKLVRQALLAYALPSTAYQITEAGRGVLQTAITDLLQQPRAFGTGFELGLANLNVLKPAQVDQAVTQHYDDLRRRLDAAETLWAQYASDDSLPEYRRALYSHNLAIMRAEVDWLAAFLDDWRGRYLTPTPKVVNPFDAPTQFHQQTQPKMAKQLQSLKRPPRAE
jgi:DNA-binding PadR family transcriptional regulator